MVSYESLSGDILVGRIYVMYLGHFNHHIGMCTASQAHSIIGTVGYPGTPKCTSLSVHLRYGSIIPCLHVYCRKERDPGTGEASSFAQWPAVPRNTGVLSPANNGRCQDSV